MTHDPNNITDSRHTHPAICPICLGLSILAILTAGFHFWPFDKIRLWQMLNVPNLCCLAGVATLALFMIHGQIKHKKMTWLPHVSIWAYIAINIFSIACADTLTRPLNYTIKLCIVLLGGYTLFRLAVTTEKALRILLRASIICTLIVVGSCLYYRLAIDNTQFGFQRNVFKYGTTIGILVPMSCLYLISGSPFSKALAILLAPLACFTAGSLGAILSIGAGLLTGVLLNKNRVVKCLLCLSFLLSGITVITTKHMLKPSALADFDLKENDQTNLRQRYIEWQAEINLLEKRGIIGTGAGSINDYRSHFYYRLPKLNTLKAFDQNGFLAVGAEIGLLGLLMFLWILVHHSQLLIDTFKTINHKQRHPLAPMLIPVCASWISMAVANLFSSIHYNGILIWFVLLLAMISSMHSLITEDSS